MKQLDELERVEMQIETIKSALRQWERQARILRIPETKKEQRMDELLDLLSEKMKLRDKLKKK